MISMTLRRAAMLLGALSFMAVAAPGCDSKKKDAKPATAKKDAEPAAAKKDGAAVPAVADEADPELEKEAPKVSEDDKKAFAAEADKAITADNAEAKANELLEEIEADLD